MYNGKMEKKANDVEFLWQFWREIWMSFYAKKIVRKKYNMYVLVLFIVYSTQLPGRVFSSSDISKKLSHHFLMDFPIGMGYQGVFMGLL